MEPAVRCPAPRPLARFARKVFAPRSQTGGLSPRPSYEPRAELRAVGRPCLASRVLHLPPPPSPNRPTARTFVRHGASRTLTRPEAAGTLRPQGVCPTLADGRASPRPSYGPAAPQPDCENVRTPCSQPFALRPRLYPFTTSRCVSTQRTAWRIISALVTKPILSLM